MAVGWQRLLTLRDSILNKKQLHRQFHIYVELSNCLRSIQCSAEINSREVDSCYQLERMKETQLLLDRARYLSNSLADQSVRKGTLTLLKMLDGNFDSTIRYQDWVELSEIEEITELNDDYQAAYDNILHTKRTMDEAIARIGVETDLLRPDQNCDTSASLGIHFTDFHALANSQLLRLLDSWQTDQQNESGVSLADVGIALGFADEDLTDFVKRFSKSKKITCQQIGKCPINGKRQLYPLFDILKNLDDFSELSRAEKLRISRHLEQVQREPKK